jgi:hypothetical protein
VLYLDHAQIKMLSKRLQHIKEKLTAEELEFMKTQQGPRKAANHLLQDLNNDKISII